MAVSTLGSSPLSVDVVIIGNGPASMILSFILHGNIPCYDPGRPHPDPVLHDKLKHSPELLQLDIARLTDHFEASRFSYSTQALPVNSLLDALIRPGGETEDAEGHTCVRWRRMPEKAVSHLVLGDAPRPGGQWTDCPAGTKWHIQSLSYAGMLSLPGYSFHEHHRATSGFELPAFTRPTRREISDYLAAYPAAVGIRDTFHCAQSVTGVSRCDGGFYIGSHGIRCKRLVLASGIFSEPKIARPLLQPLLTLKDRSSGPVSGRPPLLVIGSGFSAADIIISAPPDQKIIHIFKWAPDSKPSPLKACHQHAYPEYAGVYRLMKRAAISKNIAPPGVAGRRPDFRPRMSTPFLQSRSWIDIYEGLPNTLVTDVSVNKDGAMVTMRTHNGETLSREVSGLAYAVGRRGSLKFLDCSLHHEIVDDSEQDDNLISSRTLRSRVLADLEVAKDVFVVGSLTGDSLIRFAYGSCVFAAGKIITLLANQSNSDGKQNMSENVTTDTRSPDAWTIDQITASDRRPKKTRANNKCHRQFRRNRGSFARDDEKSKPGKRLWASCFF